MSISKIVVLAFMALVNVVAHAEVIYDWKALDNKTPQHIGLRLIFTDATVASGSFTMHVQPSQPATRIQNPGLLALLYSFPYGPNMSYRPARETLGNGFGYLDMAVSFGADGFLSGNISANNTEDNFAMSSQGPVFTFTDARSDAGMPGAGCDFSNPGACNGATGELHVVPEPMSLALFAVGALGAAVVIRKRKGQSA